MEHRKNKKREQILNQDEIDALLLHDKNRNEILEEGLDVRLFDFAKDRIVRGKMPALEMINETFVRNFNVSLFNFLKQEVSFEAGGIEIIKYEEYTSKLERPSNINIVKMPQLNSNCLFIFNAKIIHLIIDSLFGGSGVNYNNKIIDTFSSIENKIVQNILKIAFSDLKNAWSKIFELDYEYQSTESNPKMVNVINPTQMMVVNKFKINLLNKSGNFQIAIPYSAFEPVKDLLHSDVHTDSNDDNELWKTLFHEEIYHAKVKIKAILGTKSINLNELGTLKIGDVIPFTMNKNALIDVDGIPIFWAKFGISNEKYALKIEEPLSIKEFKVRSK